MFPAFVLNLKRRPDRRERFECWNRSVNMTFCVVEAIDGRDVDVAALVEAGIVRESYRDYSPGDLGCALSHRALWERCVREAQPLMIFEDDAILRADFATAVRPLIQSLPGAWEVLVLGYNFDSILDVQLVPGLDLQARFSKHDLSDESIRRFVTERRPPALLPLNNAFGLSAYAVSPRGAERLLDVCFPLANAAVGIPALQQIVTPAVTIDTFTNAHYRSVHAFCAIPPLAITPNDDSDSVRDR
jgi:glycosyl transferase family 25